MVYGWLLESQTLLRCLARYVRGRIRAATCEFDWEGVLCLSSVCRLVCTCVENPNPVASVRVTAACELEPDAGLLSAVSGSHTAIYESLIEPVLTRMLILKPDSVEQLQSQLEALKREVGCVAWWFERWTFL
jgi:hypothetical protein